MFWLEFGASGATQVTGGGSDGGVFGLGLWQSIIGGIFLLLLAALFRRFAGSRLWRLIGSWRRGEPALHLSFFKHIEAIGQRMAIPPTAPRVARLAHEGVLEPIRAFLPTEGGEVIKVVWFVPEENGDLCAREQVGYDDHEQSLICLPRGTGVAGSAFDDNRIVEIPDTHKDASFVPIKGVRDHGALICLPVVRKGHPTGVLSVLSTRPNAFKPHYRPYLQCLAAMLGAIESFQELVQAVDN